MKFLKIISILFLLQGCSSNYEWGWYILSPDNIDGLTNLKFLISGITTTIYISVVSIILAMIIGLIVALPSLSNNKFLTYFNIINSISKGQHEVSESLGMDFWRKMRLVILPQAIKVVLPAMGNQFVYVLKMSSLVSIIGIGDLTRKANELVTTTYRPLEIYTFLILEYLVLILVVSYFVRKLENKLEYK